MTTAPVKSALVLGCGGFIGHHLVKRLKREGFWVRGADLKFPMFARHGSGRLRRRRPARSRLLPTDHRPPLRRGLPARRRHGRRGLHLHRRERRRHHAQFRDDQPQRARCLPASATLPAHLLFVVRLHVPGIQPGRSRQPDLCGRSAPTPPRPTASMAGRSCFSERLYLAYNRNHGMRSPRRPLSQHLRSGRHLGWRQGKGAGRDLPQGGSSCRRRRRSRSGATATRRAHSCTSTNASKARSV